MARIELPEFMNGRLVERTYRRMIELQDAWRGRRDQRAHWLRVKGVNMAKARDGRMLLFLEKGAEYLRAKNEEQISMISQLGYAKHTEFNEYAQWRGAYEKAVEPLHDEAALHGIFGWVFAAVAEALE